MTLPSFLAPSSPPHARKSVYEIVSALMNLRFRGGLVVKAHRLLYHLTLGLRVIKRKRSDEPAPRRV